VEAQAGLGHDGAAHCLGAVLSLVETQRSVSQISWHRTCSTGGLDKHAIWQLTSNYQFPDLGNAHHPIAPISRGL